METVLPEAPRTALLEPTEQRQAVMAVVEVHLQPLSMVVLVEMERSQEAAVVVVVLAEQVLLLVLAEAAAQVA